MTYNGSSDNAYTVVYDSNGRLAKAVDGKAGITYLYEYDSLNRLIRAYQKDANGNTVFAVENSYDEYGIAVCILLVSADKTVKGIVLIKVGNTRFSVNGLCKSAVGIVHNGVSVITQKGCPQAVAILTTAWAYFVNFTRHRIR